jgi:hypothetical protein
MKKNIIIGLLAMTTLLFFVFGYLQKMDADKNAIQQYNGKLKQKNIVRNQRSIECQESFICARR